MLNPKSPRIHMNPQYGWPMRLGFSVSIGVWVTLVMWLVIQNVWVSVFALGVCLGLCILEKWMLAEEVYGLQSGARVLETQLAVLQTAVDEMSQRSATSKEIKSV